MSFLPLNDAPIRQSGIMLPLKSISKYFQYLFFIYGTYEPYLFHNQPNKFHEGTYDVRIQIQFVCILSYIYLTLFWDFIPT